MITQNLGFNGSPSRVPGAIIHPNNDNEHKDVRSQLQRILSSPVFQNSKRYAAVLKYIVDRTLAGAGEQLKERTIGIEVFNRAPDYDTATDHAVRSAVAEVRKRLAQYYQENPRDALRIDVLPGSYIPQFRSIEEQRPLAASTALPSQAPTADTSKASAAATRRPFLQFRWIVLACALLLGSLTAGHFILKPQSTLESFWGPILSSRSQVMLCIGNLEGAEGCQAAHLTPHR